MKYWTIVTTFCAILLSLAGCERKATPVITAFDVDYDTGIASGHAYGIDFTVAGASGAEVTSKFSGSPKSISRTEITLADDVKIELETIDEGNSLTFQLNGKNFGKLARGDEVAIGEDRNVTVNGDNRTNAEDPTK